MTTKKKNLDETPGGQRAQFGHKNQVFRETWLEERENPLMRFKLLQNQNQSLFSYSEDPPVGLIQSCHETEAASSQTQGLLVH